MGPVVVLEAWWAKHHFHLAGEPAGERSGLELPSPASRDPSGAVTPRPLSMAVFGDSMAVGCGVDDQSLGLVPDIARDLAEAVGRPVQWETHGRLGATIRRVRYRLLPAFARHADLVVLCAGSNDIMAGRTLTSWEDDLAASVNLAGEKGDTVVVLSSGQLYRNRRLGRALRSQVETMIDRQTEVSKRVCQEAGVCYIDATHDDVGTDREDFWGSDGFHPSEIGYRKLAACVVGKMPKRLLADLAALD